jgi:hypothetical protein
MPPAPRPTSQKLLNVELKPGQGLVVYFGEIDQLHGELAQDKDLKLSEKWLKLITYKGLPCLKFEDLYMSIARSYNAHI